MEDEVAGLLHLEGEGVAVKPQEPDFDVEESLGEVLDGEQDATLDLFLSLKQQ